MIITAYWMAELWGRVAASLFFFCFFFSLIDVWKKKISISLSLHLKSYTREIPLYENE